MTKERLLKAREERLMEFLWKQTEPLSTDEMSQRLNKEEWNFVTLNKTVKSLLDLEYIRINGVELHNTQWARRFEPSLTKDEYLALTLEARGITENNIGNVVFALLGGTRGAKSRKRDEALIAELERTIERIKARK